VYFSALRTLNERNFNLVDAIQLIFAKICDLSCYTVVSEKFPGKMACVSVWMYHYTVLFYEQPIIVNNISN
jgi:hypothetical protein